MNKLSLERARERDAALKLLSRIRLPSLSGKNGEELATDEAAVWKRVLNFRIARYLKPHSIFESHPGLGISTCLYRFVNRDVVLLSAKDIVKLQMADLVDIDPFGQPWDIVGQYVNALRRSKVIMITNGEAYAVTRRWTNAQRHPSRYYGRKMPRWVVEEYLPRLESILRKPCRFFYVFPSTVRSIHSKLPLPKSLFAGCPQWMWWLKRYPPDIKKIGIGKRR